MMRRLARGLRESAAEYGGWLLAQWLELRSNPPHVGRGTRVAAGVIAACGAAAAFGVAPMIADEPPPATQWIEQPVPAEAAAQIARQAEALEDSDTTLYRTVRNTGDDTFGALLAKLGIEDTEAVRFLRTSPVAQKLLARSTRTLTAATGDDGTLESLRLRSVQLALGALADTPAATDTVITRTAAGFEVRDEVVPLQRQVRVARGTIRTSLFAAADAAEMPDSVTQQLADIFAGDIDFSSDLRRGDEFQVAYEVYTLDGEPLRAGRLLAAQFINAGRRYEAVWYQPAGRAGSYYSFDGKSLKRAFLRNPIEFSRISSGFGMRVHPIAHQWKQHKGVDFAAPQGTAIRASGDGVIKFAGTQRGYGNVIEIEHRGGITTLYGHMRNFAAGMRSGARVQQGDIIGYVGHTGWATGPHLHYEFRVHGQHVNPLTVALPEATPIGPGDAAAFAQASELARHRLALATQIVTASAR